MVDDEPHIRDLLKRYFELERYAVGLAQDGQEALEMISQTNYDGVLLDISMPAMNGLGLYRCIEKIDESLARKVVFITGDTVSSDTREFLRDVGKPVVTKPFRLEELLRKVQGIWDHQPAMPA